jgi:site-specific recombinase XerD
MSTFAPTIEAFFTERLMTQREARPRTVAAYRDTLRMLLCFIQAGTGKAPSQLDVADVDAKLVSAFLTYLEAERHNSARTRNTRLAAIHSLFRYAALRHPEHAELIQRVLAIPNKRHDRSDVSYLQPVEVDVLLAAPDRGTWFGRRDHALLVLAVQTGLRVSELTGLNEEDLELGPGARVRCRGKGRKRRKLRSPVTTYFADPALRRRHSSRTKARTSLPASASRPRSDNSARVARNSRATCTLLTTVDSQSPVPPRDTSGSDRVAARLVWPELEAQAPERPPVSTPRCRQSRRSRVRSPTSRSRDDNHLLTCARRRSWSQVGFDR